MLEDGIASISNDEHPKVPSQPMRPLCIAKLRNGGLPGHLAEAQDPDSTEKADINFRRKRSCLMRYELIFNNKISVPERPIDLVNILSTKIVTAAGPNLSQTQLRTAIKHCKGSMCTTNLMHQPLAPQAARSARSSQLKTSNRKTVPKVIQSVGKAL